MVASETTNANPITTSRQSELADQKKSGLGKLAPAFVGLFAAAFMVQGVSAWAAESKPETKADAKADTKADAKADAKGGKGDAVIESELRKALIGKSALTGELLMKTGDDVKASPTKSSTSAAPNAKEAKAPKSAESAVGKKMAMPAAEGRAGKDTPVAGPTPAAASAPAPATALAASNSAGSGHDQVATVAHEKAAKGGAHWGYTGSVGPESWAKLSAEFATCGKGRRQSPIDLVDRDLSQLNLERVKFEYLPAAFQVVHNGHTIEVRPAGVNQIVARSKNYKLLQFHFHHPSEERVNGKGFSLDAHFVHRADDGELAVVTVLFEEGAANPELQRIWDYMPLDSNSSERSGEGVTFNPLSMLPAERTKYLQYIGSLTTPPCTEGVVWIVLRQPVTVSAEQIALFRKMVGMNARPVQAVNGRLIKASN
jgi:carbonic anhydrase